VGLDSFLGHIVGACIVVVGDDIGSGRIHHIDIEVDTLVLVLGLAIDFDFVGDEQLARAIHLVERVILPLQEARGMVVWKKC